MFSKFPVFVTCSAIAIAGLSSMTMGVAEAALFDQEEVEQESYIAIAAPLPQGGRYNLIVIEQKSGARECWQETAEPGVIEPLLLNFDFTGICGRSTDSNGYSIRQVGEDLALKYRLSIQKKGGVLVLMGVPESSAFGKPIEIGRTETLQKGYLKFNLNPDWKFTRRSYQGKVLGHVYFTRDVIPPEPVEEPIEIVETQAEEDPSETSAIIENSEIESKDIDEPVSLPVESAPEPPEPVAPPSLDPGLPAWPTTGQPSQESTLPEPNNPSTGVFSSPSVPSIPSRVAPLQGPVQIPVPLPPSSRSGVGRLNTVRSLPSVPNRTSTITPLTPGPNTIIPVPSIAPLGKIGPSEPDVFYSRDLARLPQGGAVDSGAPPPPAFAVAQSIRRYRVFVPPSQDSDAIRAIAPDAFVTRHNGQRMLQLGSFLEKSKADLMLQALGQQGISAIIDAAQY